MLLFAVTYYLRLGSSFSFSSDPTQSAPQANRHYLKQGGRQGSTPEVVLTAASTPRHVHSCIHKHIKGIHKYTSYTHNKRGEYNKYYNKHALNILHKSNRPVKTGQNYMTAYMSYLGQSNPKTEKQSGVCQQMGIRQKTELLLNATVQLSKNKKGLKTSDVLFTTNFKIKSKIEK